MPTYRVRCNDCGKVFDAFVRIKEMDGIKCECGGNTKWVPTAFHYQSIMFGKENNPLVLEHMTDIDEPNVEVTTKQQLQEACKKHNCISPILD